ncbi:peptidoglycan-binding domain-containing protein [Micromonospora sediminicola]|uniref:peptidoglycan-binding domain-containing protein n=1 Tax=Micromonospora sediminicola TaxID=946078 RepID=UPI0033CA7B2F
MSVRTAIRPRSIRLLAAVVIAVLTSGLIHTPAAHASVSYGYISGASTVTDDFGDEGTLKRGGSYAYTNATALWQWILYAEGLISKSGIDCQFGPGTETATKQFQSRYGLSADGVVGLNTWKTADNRLSLTDSSYPEADVVTYTGKNGGKAVFNRAKAGESYYSFRVDPYNWAGAAYFAASRYCGGF